MTTILTQYVLSGAFEDEDVTHVEGDVNPVRDLEIIFDELRLKDLEYAEKNVQHMEKNVMRGQVDKGKKAEFVSFMVFLSKNTLNVSIGSIWIRACHSTVGQRVFWC